MSLLDTAQHPSDQQRVSLSLQKDGLGLPLPTERTSWPSSPDEDPDLLSFPLEEPGPRSLVPGNLPSPAFSLEEEEQEEDDGDTAEPEGLRSEEHPSQFFAEAQRLREQRLLLDEEVTVAGRVYGLHRVILAAVSSLFRDRLLSGGRSRSGFSLDVAPGGWEAVLTFAYEGVLGPASLGDVLAAAEALGAPRVKAAAQRKCEEPGNSGEEEKKLSQAEELRENLRSIELLYREGVGCDLELEADGYRLRVHRAALACGSEFFGAMLLSGMRESQGTEVSLRTISSQDLRLLVSFAYSGIVRARWLGLLRAAQAALQYQSSSCLALCQRALARDLSPARCLALFPMAEAPGLERLWSKARHYLLTHLPAVALCPAFPSLPAAFLAELLDSDELHVQEEFEAFVAARCWLAANPETQESEAKALLQCVRFGRMSTRELRKVRAAGLPPPLPPDLLYQLLVEADVPGQERWREPDRALVVIGGDELRPDMARRQPSRKVWWARAFRCGMGLVRTVEWGRLPALPAPGRFRHGAASLAGSELYVCGGQDFYSHSNTLASTLRWDPSQEDWEEVAPLCQARSFFPLVALDGQLYALGGRNDGVALDSVETYNPELNIWRPAPALPAPCFAHAAAILEDRLYVSGGCNGTGQYLASLLHYDPKLEKPGTFLSPMGVPRAGHVMAALGGRLYVAGGLGETGDLLSFEAYEPRTDSWTRLAPLPSPHVGAAAAVLQGELLVLGGYSHRTYALSHLIHAYCPGLGRWLCLGTLPRPRAEMPACLLTLPTVQHIALVPTQHQTKPAG
ncbi:kelch-like protein 33 isoform X1 [Sciurus carolinensis]|uniref:kelch-like protein 33 isoform X1 n=2 Tax=Sciurus carolinensis TaxID=30640 RepID=UPI001FB1E3BD|nr:kelch-like protein 33 isoform X1 [Sciurus carolinensis]XP_047395722.1 kelch-like protein 33 isoform X1 [Sciurus carolinensis]XP_047395723.1 kelch-like protein 33 isoform X1 [Sciurus carolinensis]